MVSWVRREGSTKVANEQARGNVIVTGAAGGIGQALVKCFAGAGYGVIGTDKVAAPTDFAGQNYVRADLQRTVEEAEYAHSVFEQIRASFGGRPLKALINNAAIQILGPANTLSRNDWRATLDVNLLAPFFWAQAFLPELEPCHGSVLNISSIHAHLTKPNFIAYATSKAALSGMTRAMAVDLGKRVRVNAIEPAAIETHMLRESFEKNPDGFRHLQDYHPAGRIGRVEEVARLAIAIVDGEMDFMHGACAKMDGGIGVRLYDPD